MVEDNTDYALKIRRQYHLTVDAMIEIIKSQTKSIKIAGGYGGFGGIKTHPYFKHDLLLTRSVVKGVDEVLTNLREFSAKGYGNSPLWLDNEYGEAWAVVDVRHSEIDLVVYFKSVEAVI